MHNILFIQVHSSDGKTVEGAMSQPEESGHWSVTHSDGREERLHESDMPKHWQDELARAKAFNPSD